MALNPVGACLDLVSQAEFDAQGPSGRELGYVSTATGVWLITSTAWAGWTALTLDVDIGVRPVEVRAELPAVWQQVGTGKLFYCRIRDLTAAATIAERTFRLEDASEVHPLTVANRHAPAAGVRQYRVEYKVEAGATYWILAYDLGLWGLDPSEVASLTVTER